MPHRHRIDLDGPAAGPWTIRIDPDDQTASGFPVSLPAEGRPIIVPAPWQATGADLPQEGLRHYVGAATYERAFDAPAGWPRAGQCAVLHFGAVDYIADVYLNDAPVGSHTGGYLPFDLDVTAALRPGRNTLRVRVDDSPDRFPEIAHGKQSWYGMLSGIWQSVYLEIRPALHIVAARITPDLPTGRVAVEVDLSQPLPADARLRAEILAPDDSVVATDDFADVRFSLDVPNPLPWDITGPNLYRLRLTITSSGDAIEEHFGFRTIETRAGQILLNGRPVYIRAALDQNYYPDLIYTAPSAEYIESEMRQALAMGFNCLRLHIKIGDPRYYDLADRLGLLIWTELPNHEELTAHAQQQARATITEMVRRDWNHPSIIIWTIINENWGLDITDPAQRQWLSEEYDHLKALDPHRLVVDNSPCWGNAHVVTDIEDFHNYYAMPDHFNHWRDWIAQLSRRPWWTFAHEYRSYKEARRFMKDPWHVAPRPPAAENRRRGDEPLLMSEFGNWGLPDLDQLRAGYGGKEPWWFETGHDWGKGVVYPHGIEERFNAHAMWRAFGSLAALIRASQRLQTQAVKAEIEEMRRHNSIQGYVLTELTDVHWEANGVLDMRRNPKPIAGELPAFNGDDIVFAQLYKTAYYTGDQVRLKVHVSHYSPADLNNAQVRWELEGTTTGGLFRLGELPIATVVEAGQIRFRVPTVTEAGPRRLLFRLLTAQGEEVTRNYHELWFFPKRQAPAEGIRLFSPDIPAETLADLGYDVAATPANASVVVVRTVTDEHRDYMLAGGKVLWLAETNRSRRTYLNGIGIKEREDEVWEGNWASSLIWINRDRLFRSLPGDGLADFMFYGITPEHVLTNFRAYEYLTEVHAGLSVGWLHRTVALIGGRPLGKGRFLASAFRLSRHLLDHPVAALMFDDMVAHLAGS